MNSSAFDPDLFLSTTIDKELDTKLIPCPAEEYVAIIDDVKPRMAQGKDGKPYLMFDVLWRIDDEAAKQATGRDKIIVRQTIFIDRNETGGLDTSKGKNVQLGKLREAVGQNRPGQAWSPASLKGSTARVKVNHRPVTDEASGETTIYDEVKVATKL